MPALYPGLLVRIYRRRETRCPRLGTLIPQHMLILECSRGGSRRFCGPSDTVITFIGNAVGLDSDIRRAQRVRALRRLLW
jgi:hypothetical protein